jgi:hypothetical protein
LKDIQQLPAILQHSKTPFTLYMLTLLTFSGATILESQKKHGMLLSIAYERQQKTKLPSI